MSNEPSARAIVPEAPSEDDYEALSAALSATERGRAFLAEYARRQRAADTGVLMSAIERLEGILRNETPPQGVPASADAMRAELYTLLTEIRTAQGERDASGLAAQVARLVETVELVARRLEAIVAPAEEQAPTESETEIETADRPDEPAEFALPVLAMEIMRDARAAHDLLREAPESPASPPVQATAIPTVGWFDEQVAAPEKPAEPPSTPVANATGLLAIGAVIEAAATAAAAEPEAPTVTVLKAGTIPPPMPFAGEDFEGEEFAGLEPEEAEAAASSDPLAAIKALSEEERLALFT